MQSAQLKILLLLAAAAAAAAVQAGDTQGHRGRYPTPSYEKPSYWPQQAKRQMKDAEKVWQQMRYEAKSAILFIGDGMGPTSVTAGRILKGQLAGTSGEDAVLEFDSMPHAGLIKTYSADGQTADSAATATAFLTGVKARDGVIGLNEDAVYKKCGSYSPRDHDMESFLVLAQKEGKSVGIVTTTRLTHATPAAAYANCVSRAWECDTDRNKDSNSETHEQKQACPDIAKQLIDKAINFTVILGGGRTKFLPKEQRTVNYAASNATFNATVAGQRSDQLNLIKNWRQRQAQAGRRAMYVETRDQLMGVDVGSIDYLLGVVATSHLRYNIENIEATNYKEPSLKEMVEVAVRILQKNPKGFILLVEGGRIDHAHHGNKAQQALHDVVALDEAVATAKKMTSPEDTLLVVSADHSHVFTLGHYGRRGQPILGLMLNRRDDSKLLLASDSKTYTPLHYADGRSAKMDGARANISVADIVGKQTFAYQSLVPKSSESHGGEDVGVYAVGPGAQLFNSVQDQTYIAHAIMKSGCIGWYKDNDECLRDPKNGAAVGAVASMMVQLGAAAVAAVTAAGAFNV